jgi:hypothetical protein
MKPDDSLNDESRDGSWSIEAIEAALRRLPAIDVPRGLEEKLVAAIPRPMKASALKHTSLSQIRPQRGGQSPFAPRNSPPFTGLGLRLRWRHRLPPWRSGSINCSEKMQRRRWFLPNRQLQTLRLT